MCCRDLSAKEPSSSEASVMFSSGSGGSIAGERPYTHWYGVTPPTWMRALPANTASDNTASIEESTPSRVSCASMQCMLSLSNAPRLSMKRACWPGALNFGSIPKRRRRLWADGLMRPSSPSQINCCMGPCAVNQLLWRASKSSLSFLETTLIAECHLVQQQMRWKMTNSR